MELVEVARALYALPPEEFTAARTTRSREARAAGDRDLAAQVAALRKPSAAAWTVDRLVRTDPGRVRALVDLGRRLARAQEDLAGADLRALGREQHRLLGEARAAVLADADASGRSVTDAVLAQVEQTLRAAMADVGAAAAVGSALLTTHLTSTGFETVDVEGAVGVPGAASLLDDDGGGPAIAGSAEPRTTDGDGDDDVVTLPGVRRTGGSPRASAGPTDQPVTLRGTGVAGAARATTGGHGHGDPADRRTRSARATRAARGTDDATRTPDVAQRGADDASRHVEERREEQRREQARRAEAEAALAAASEAAERARAALGAATDVARAEADREAALAAEVDAAAERLADLQRQHAAARVAHRRAEAARRTAAREATTAAGRVEAARERLERS